MAYLGVNLQNSITIKKIYSIHYFEYMNNFSFSGESHNFWEFVCVDKGEVGVSHGENYTILKKNDLIFHKPNEFHDVKATGGIAPNLVVISFDCNDYAMHFFNDRILQIDETERNLLANIIIEARHCFNCRLDDPYLQNIVLKESELFGSQQMIKLHLEHFLIHLIRRYSTPLVFSQKLPNSTPPKITKAKSDAEIFRRVVDYLESHLTAHLTTDQICKDNPVGRSQLQKIFKEYCTLGIIEFFSTLKINAAKELIRTNEMNFTQIAEHLGYSSIHYFSRQFKKISEMNPSEYASSIKAMAEGNFKE